MKHSEIFLAWLACVAAVFCVTAFLFKPAFDSWGEVRNRKKQARLQIEQETAIRQKKEATEKSLHELQKKVTALPAGEMPNVCLPKLVNGLAQACKVPLKDTRIGDEWTMGKLCILPIKYSWGETDTRGITELLLAFHESDVIFDVVELTIRSSGQDRLNGSLTVNCVYTK